MNQIKQAFTLVELIVVVTILAILATIGFVSYSGYLTGVRDTNRVASLTAISDGLELYRTKNDLPLPDNSIEVQVESEIIARQGYAGSNVLQTIEYSKAGKDPKDDQYYSYYLTDDKKHYQMMAFLEESDNLETKLTQPHPQSLSLETSPNLSLKERDNIENNLWARSSPIRRSWMRSENFLGIVHAATDYSNRHPKVYGKRLGILTDSDNTPIQEIITIKNAGNLNIQNTAMVDEYVSHLSDILLVSGTGTQLISSVLSTGVGNTMESCREILEKNNKTAGIDGMYNITFNGSLKRVYCDMTTQGGGFTKVLAYNGSQLHKSEIDDEDWYQDNENYSHLFGFKGLKNIQGKYEFYIRGYDSIGGTMWFHFSQDNAYDQNPVGNNYVKIGGDFRDTYYIDSTWHGLAIGIYGNGAMSSTCAIANSYGNLSGTSWYTCLIDNHTLFGAGPWDTSLGDIRNIEIYQK